LLDIFLISSNDRAEIISFNFSHLHIIGWLNMRDEKIAKGGEIVCCGEAKLKTFIGITESRPGYRSSFTHYCPSLDFSCIQNDYTTHIYEFYFNVFTSNGY